jgi:SAM-dependent methyltransferase
LTVPKALSAIKSSAERRAAHVVFSSRRWLQRRVSDLAPGFADADVLEIGSGRTDLGSDAYSMRRLFPASTHFVKSDVNPTFGHLQIDITTMEVESAYDLILCLSVFEHVRDFWAAPPRLHRALRPGGTLLLSTPMMFPYHDEPDDYYRFTSYGLREVLRGFNEVEVRHRGARRLPFAVLAIARK